MRELVIATGNRGKLKELEALLEGVVERVVSVGDFPRIPHIEEDGATFRENAIKKARLTSIALGMPVLADDSGLEVDALDGKPGVYSARYAGPGANDVENNMKLLSEMSGLSEKERGAAFRCVIAICLPDGRCETFDGELCGTILDSPRGTGGFGYDPLFLVPEYAMTLAELPLEAKNSISHRGKALVKAREFLLHLQL